MPTFTTRQIAEHVAGRLQGDADVSIGAVRDLASAGPGDLAFVRDTAHRADALVSTASVLLVPESFEADLGPDRTLIRVKDVGLAFVQVLQLYAPPPPRPEPGVHPSASVHPTATLGRNAAVGPNCTVGPDVVLGSDVVLHANVTLMDQVQVGDGTVLMPGVVVRERCTIGARCLLHANVVIGTEGFGVHPMPDGSGAVAIPQIGGVRIGDDVHLGAGTCVDRGTLSDTVVGDGCKIDNLCQIGHNCRLGRCVIIAGHVAVAGSVTFGDGVIVGGNAAFKDHITIGAGARFAGSSAVITDVPAGETWGGYPAKEIRQALKEFAAVRKLPSLVDEFRQHLKQAGRTPRKPAD